MNKKGLTLVEVIAVLVVLSIIAVIVTPNIAVGIKDYKNRVLQTQLSTIKSATKNWVVDNIDKVSCNGTTALKVSVPELQEDGYLDDNLKNFSSVNFDDAFGLVFCTTIEDETGNLDTNYKYEYGGYENMDDYYQKMAVKYVKKKKIYSDTTVTTSTLKSEGFIYNTIKDTTGATVSIASKTINIKITEGDDGEYLYETSL